MQNNAQKFVFLAVVVAAVLFSARMYPGVFINGNTSNADGGSGAAAATGTPIFVLPSLTANIGAQDPTAAPAVPASATDSGSAAPAITPAPDVGASAVLIADLTTGKSYLDLNADERWPMASVSKLMTAAVATDVLSPDVHITITSQMVAVDPTEQVLHVGDTYTVADLMHVMLLPSNNVAAEALADFYGRANFLAAMNAKAQAWGMAGTYYDDPSGLSAANESTASDLLKLAQHIYAQYPQVLAITRMPQATVENLSTGQSVTVESINHFAGTPDFIGGKTGYTDQADGNLLSLFSYDGRPVFVVVLGIDDGVRFDATQELYAWFRQNYR
ncbi:MAG TPA: serine hydrolase [Candidatus Paceibacterota bacterium]|nr:serine hydrolase [Candidatus Paceibacterota bacterium]